MINIKIISSLLIVLTLACPALAQGEVYARSGSYAMKVTLDNNPKWNGPYQFVQVEKGQDYVCRVWSRGTGEFSLQIKDFDWALIKKTNVYGTDHWTETTLEFNSGEFDKIILALIDANTSGAMYIDDFYLGPKDGSRNLATNGSFEAGGFMWSTAQSFSIVKGEESDIPYDPLLIDTYGQFIKNDFSNKITNDRELVETVKWDEQYYNSLITPKDRDKYSGLLGSKEEFSLKATGFFRLEKLPSGEWTMVTPDGNIFFSLGINGVGYVGDTYTNMKDREEIYKDIPSPKDEQYKEAFHSGNAKVFSHYVANQVRKYQKPFDPTEYALQQLERIKKWGFNTAGPISSMQIDNEIPIIIGMPMPDNGRLGTTLMYDVFRETWESEVDNAAKAWLTEHANNPWIVAYYLVNEPRFNRMETEILTKKASQIASKKKFVDILKDIYNNDVTEFNSSWETDYTSMDALYETTDLTLKTEKSKSDFDQFKQEFFERYYKVTSEVFRKYDKNHILGTDRVMTSHSNEDPLAEIIYGAAGKYVDYLTLNNYRRNLYMDKILSLYEIGGKKPFMFTEFSFPDTSRGHRSSFSTTVPTPELKGSSYRHYVEQYAATGVVIGTHWFLYIDESATGRHYEGINGESFAMGLLDVTDRPYLEVVSQMKETNDNIYKVILDQVPPFEYDFFGQILTPAQLAKDKFRRAMVLMLNSPMALVNNVQKTIDEDKSVTPVSVDGRTLVPVRFIAENLGAEVLWNAATSTVTLKLDDKEIKFTIGKDSYLIDGKEHSLDVSAQVIGERTMIPLRAMAEALGRQVFWDPKGLIVMSNRTDILDSTKDNQLIDYLCETNF